MPLRARAVHEPIAGRSLMLALGTNGACMLEDFTCSSMTLDEPGVGSAEIHLCAGVCGSLEFEFRPPLEFMHNQLVTSSS